MIEVPWKLGCIIFDEPSQHTTGWAAWIDQNGNRSEPYRIDGTNSLPTDIVWWINLTFEEMSMAKLSFNARFRGEGFLRTKMDVIFKEWGVSQSSPDEKAYLGAIVFWRVMFFVFIHYGFTRVPQDSLKNGIRDVWEKDPLLPDPIREALGDALTEYAQCEQNGATGGRPASFLVPRSQHARVILSSPVPGNAWKVVPEKLIPKGQVVDRSFRDHLIDLGGPALIHAVISDIDPEKNSILGFGSGIRQRKNAGSKSLKRHWESNRSWLTIDEAMVVSAYAKVTVKNLIVTDPGKTMLLSDLTPSWPEQMNGNHEFLSWSYGLFLENVWIARAYPFPKELLASGWQVFYRSFDHVASMKAAWELSRSGIVVLGYGAGRIAAKVPDFMTPQEVAVAALSAGVVPDSLPEPVNVHVEETAPIQRAMLGYLIRGSSDADRYRYHESDKRCVEKHWDYLANKESVRQPERTVAR